MTTQPGMMGMGMPVIPGSQPVVWMTRPQPLPGCPAGLEYLTSIDQLLVKQQRELLESETVTYSFIHILFFVVVFFLSAKPPFRFTHTLSWILCKFLKTEDFPLTEL